MAAELFKIYPWLKVANSVEEYIEPNYYDHLLKQYTFGGKDDLSLLKGYIDTTIPRNIRNALELCSGSGRVSKLVSKLLPETNLILSDLSGRMLEHTKRLLKNHENYEYLEMDAVDLLGQLGNRKVDFLYTLWGFSHSVHQHVHLEGYEKTREKLAANLRIFLTQNLSPNGKMFIMHFDSMSDEQRILMRQWQRVYPTFSDVSMQSPSKRMLDSLFLELDNNNTIYLGVKHFKGDPIVYKDENEVLEIFMNFHLETFFNDSELLKVVLNDIKKQIKQYRNTDGTYSIATGCYVYTIERRI